jgi:UDP-N-acetylmuramate dehydrogenase
MRRGRVARSQLLEENRDVDGSSRLRGDVPLAELTTLELGGLVQALVEVDEERDLVEALRWAAGERLPVAVLGGGSNIVAADSGFDGVVVRMMTSGIEVRAGHGDDRVLVTASAGELWDELVEMAVAEGLGGIECLAGIPGTVGATPIQNAGAYGQEVADTIVAVRVLDRSTLEVQQLTPAQCGFGYRTSVFRQEPWRYVVLAVTLRLVLGARGSVRYPELSRALGTATAAPDVAAVRNAVLDLRRAKSMVLDPDDENRRSVGSFFVNPVVARELADEVAERAVACGAASGCDEMPCYAAAGGRVKLSAAWLVERAGFAKGTRRGAVGISSRHALALVHHGGGTAAELVALAREIRRGVAVRFGVLMYPEPTFLGFAVGDPVTEP